MIPYSQQFVEADDQQAVLQALTSSHLTQGPATEAFEKALAAYLGVKHVVAVASGTAALHLVTLHLSQQGGSLRGFVPPITFAATLNCLWYVGAQGTLVDVDPLSGQMTPATLEAALSSTPRAAGERWVVFPVSLQGRPLDYAGLRAVAERYDALLVEDAAHAMGGYYTSGGSKRMMGGCADTYAAITSMHALKQLCAGEGGAVITNDDALAATARLMRSHGIVRPGRAGEPAWHYEQVALGLHYRISDIHCALGLSQLRKLDSRQLQRHQLALRYDAAFASVPFAGRLRTLGSAQGHAYHLYVVHLPSSAQRDAAQEALKKSGFFTQIHYTPLYRFPYHRQRLADASALPGAEAYFAGTLSIPLSPQLSYADQDRFLAAFADFLSSSQSNQVPAPEGWTARVSQETPAPTRLT
jgi:perosamine synthetase